MIRFIDLRNQGTYHRFAFWDTVVSEFIRIDGDVAWDDRQQVVEGITWDYEKAGKSAEDRDRRIKRLTSLMPDWAIVDDGKGEEEWEK